jgi:hypothetical protein
VPSQYFQPLFYDWAGSSWTGGVSYSWGWGPSQPWFFSGYFTPAPVHDRPALWLTDFDLAADLRAVYASRQPTATPAPAAPVTPEVKLPVAEEAKRHIGDEKTASTQLPTAQPGAEAEPPVLKTRIFVVASPLDVVSVENKSTCSLSACDVSELPAYPTHRGKPLLYRTICACSRSLHSCEAVPGAPRRRRAIRDCTPPGRRLSRSLPFR